MSRVPVLLYIFEIFEVCLDVTLIKSNFKIIIILNSNFDVVVLNQY